MTSFNHSWVLQNHQIWASNSIGKWSNEITTLSEGGVQPATMFATTMDIIQQTWWTKSDWTNVIFSNDDGLELCFQFFQKNSKFPIQDTFQNFWSTAAELFDFIKNIRINFHKIFAKTYLENDGFDYIVWFWDFSCFRPKTQNFRSSFKLLRPIGFRKKNQIISNDNACQYTSKNHDFDQFPWFFLSFWCKTRIFRSTSEALIWRFFMCDIFFSIIQELYVLRIKYPIWSVFGVSWTSIRSKQAILVISRYFRSRTETYDATLEAYFDQMEWSNAKKKYHQSIRNRFLHRI